MNTMLTTRRSPKQEGAWWEKHVRLLPGVLLFFCTILLCGCYNKRPTAVFTASHVSGSVPLTVSFDAALSFDPDGQILTYRWDFGDGQSGNGERATHTYESPGAYTVKLTVSDDNGTAAFSTLLIRAKAPDPVIHAVGDTANNGDIQITLRAVRFAAQIGQWKPDPERRFLVVDLHVEAVTDAQRVANWDFKVVHGDSPTQTGQDIATFSLDNFFNCPALDAGEGSEGEIAFEVYPADSYLLEYDDHVHVPIRFRFTL